jgi:SAM-dependent methyltransferase
MALDDVRNYYNSMTSAFLRVGGASRSSGSLHRSLRAPRPADGIPPIHTVDALILDELQRIGALGAKSGRPLIADLGCGVGATLAWLAARTDAELVGITLSEHQAAVARERFPRISPLTVGSFDDPAALFRMTGGRSLTAAYMIESFVHAPDARRALGAIAERTEPGGHLLICDDLASERLASALMVHEARGPDGVRQSIALANRFRRGWHVSSFLSADRIATLGQDTGWELVRVQDLSGLVMTYRPRDIVARIGSGVASALGLRGSWWENVAGGSALQRLIHRRAVRYSLLTLRRTG